MSVVSVWVLSHSINSISFSLLLRTANTIFLNSVNNIPLTVIPQIKPQVLCKQWRPTEKKKAVIVYCPISFITNCNL